MKRLPPIDATIYFAITIFTFLFVALVIASPFLIASSNRALLGAGMIFYNLATWFCHQLPQRSFSLWGSWFPLDARMTGMFLGGLVGLISPLFTRYSRPIWPWIVAAILIVPLAIDGISQTILLMRESNNVLRFLTGSMAGFGIFYLLSFALLQNYEYRFKRLFEQTKALRVAVYVNVLVLILLFGAGFLLGGSLVSKSEALSIAKSKLKREKFEAIKVYWLPPNSTLSITWDPYLNNYDDVILEDLEDLPNLYPVPSVFKLYLRPFVRPNGTWLIAALKKKPPEASSKSVFFPKTPGEYFYIDSVSHKILARLRH